MCSIIEKCAVTWFVCFTVVCGQPTALSNEACLYAGADWLKLICQSEGGERSVVSLPLINYARTGQPSREVFLTCSVQCSVGLCVIMTECLQELFDLRTFYQCTFVEPEYLSVRWICEVAQRLSLDMFLSDRVCPRRNTCSVFFRRI